MRAAAVVEKPRIKKILSVLAREYPEARTALCFGNVLELLVATVLSAQCTDARVNQVTASLFRNYRTAEDYASAPPGKLEADIRSTGFYRNKAKAIRGFCEALVKQHGGEVPRSMEDLLALPGVGRKTANLVRAEGFGVPGMVVDTHVSRISQRLGLTQRRDPDKIEHDLCQLMQPEQWNHFGLRLIDHGRKVCKARKPLCHQCPLVEVCPTGLARI